MATTHVPPTDLPIDLQTDPALERAVIGAVLCNPPYITPLMRIVSPDDFSTEAHRIIWQTMCDLGKAGTPPDLTLMNAELLRREATGAVASEHLLYLADLIIEVEYPTYANFYAERVADLAEQRRLYQQVSASLTSYHRGDATADQLIDELPSMLRDARRVRRDGAYIHLSDVGDDVYGPFVPRAFFGGQFADLDALVGGIENGQMIAVGARPSVGKTAFLLQSLWQVAANQGTPVGIVSLEMPSRSLRTRLLAYLSGVDIAAMKRDRRRPNGFEQSALDEARDEIRMTPIFVDEEPRRTIDSIAARIRAMHAEQGVGIVGIDYLQLMVQDSKAENRAQELSRISATVKQLAMELDIPIICLAQLNRGIESRHDPAPKLSDFKDSGSIEQDADVAIMLHRDERFKKRVLGDFADTSPRTFVRFGVEKNRNGATGKAMLEYVGYQTKFLTLDADLRRQLRESD